MPIQKGQKLRLGAYKMDPAIVKKEYIEDGLLIRELVWKYHLGHATIQRYLSGLTLEEKLLHIKNRDARQRKEANGPGTV